MGKSGGNGGGRSAWWTALIGTAALVVPTSPALAADDAHGGGAGNLRSMFTVRAINQDRLCFRAVGAVESYPQVGSNSAYAATYRVGALTYSGPVTIRLNPFESFQNAQGSYGTDECQLNTLGAASRIPGGTLRGELPDRRIACNYTDGSWRRVETVVTMTLRGACTVTVDGAGSARADTSELHEGVGYAFEPHEERDGFDPGDFTSFPLPPDGLMWADTFTAPGPPDPLPPRPAAPLPPDLPPVP